MSYDLVMIDPPWHWKPRGKNGDLKSATRHYPVMSLDALHDLELTSITAKNSVVMLWVLDSMIPEAMSLLKTWGFTYKTVGFYWTKRTKHGKQHIGTGYYTRANPEQCWIATRGKGLPVRSHSVRRWIDSPVRAHSQKPDEAYLGAEALFGTVTRLDMFSRQARPGWDVAGNEIDGLDIREWIARRACTP